MSKLRRFLVLAAFCLPCLLLAQFASPVLDIAPAQTFTIKRGSTATQTLELSLKPGFHVNSDKPKDEFLVPIKLTWNPGPLTAKQISYPSAEEVKVGSDTLSVFTGKFKIQTQFAASAQASPGIAIIKGKLHYQACDNQSCKRPVTVDVQAPVSVQ